MTQQELADQLGVTNKAVSKWEKGHSMPDVALFEPLCKELEISIPELLSGRRIDAEDQQQTAEQLLMESISMRKLIGLSVFLQLNSIIGVLLVISPFLFHP
jgi:transcriptional regulator with XRE-family HTH domain